MKKPVKGTILVQSTDPAIAYLVVDEEPKNWKEAIAVRRLLPSGRLGALRFFDQRDIGEHVIGQMSLAGVA